MMTVAVPSWAAKKTSVKELKETLLAMQDARKTDDDVATRLKDVELSEELTGAALNGLIKYVPGPLSTVEMYILRGRSAMLAPPAADLPTAPAPDVAAQKAILAKAVDYVTKVHMQNPHLTVSKTTMRFQNGVQSIRTNSGVTNNMPNVGRSWELPNMTMRLLGQHTDTVENDKGVEIVPKVKQKAPWDQNGQVSEGGPGPMLSVMLEEAAAAGKLTWLRWEMVRGKQTAVFSYSVDKKKSHYQVNYCCFPITEDAGRMGYEGTDANFQTVANWKPFKAVAGYHGKFYIDPETGIILRAATQAELKPTDFVHEEEMRIDYGPVTVDGKSYVLPVESFTLTEVVPNGDNYAARYSVRNTLFQATYSNYKPAGPEAPGSK